MLHCLQIRRIPPPWGRVWALVGLLWNGPAPAQPQPCSDLPHAFLAGPPPSQPDFSRWLSDRLLDASRAALRCAAPLDALYYAGVAATVDTGRDLPRRTFAELLAAQGRADEAFLVQQQRCLATAAPGGQRGCDPTIDTAARAVVARARALQPAPAAHHDRYAVTLWQTAAVALDVRKAVQIQLQDAADHGLPAVELGLLLRLQRTAEADAPPLRPEQWERLAQLRARLLLPDVTSAPTPPPGRSLLFDPLPLPGPDAEPALSPLVGRPPAPEPTARLPPAILLLGVGTTLEWRRMQLYATVGNSGDNPAQCRDSAPATGPAPQAPACPRRDFDPRPYVVVSADLYPFARLRNDWLRGIGASVRGGLALRHPPAGTPDGGGSTDSVLSLLAYRVDAMALWGYVHGFTTQPTGPRLMMRLHLHYAHRSMPHQPLSAQTQWDPSIRDWTLPALTYMQWAWGASLHFYAFQIRNVELSARLSFSHNITQSTNKDIETVRPSGESRRVYTGFGPIRSGRGLQVDVTPLELRIGRHAAFSVYTSYEEHQLTFDSGTDLSAPPADINTKIANQIATMDDIYITLGAKLSWVH